MNNLGQRLKAARESAGFTQESLAELIGVSRTAVARWESGDTEPKIQNLVCLAEILNISTDMLLGVSSSRSNALSQLSDKAVFALEQFIGEIRKN